MTEKNDHGAEKCRNLDILAAHVPVHVERLPVEKGRYLRAYEPPVLVEADNREISAVNLYRDCVCVCVYVSAMKKRASQKRVGCWLVCLWCRSCEERRHTGACFFCKDTRSRMQRMAAVGHRVDPLQKCKRATQNRVENLAFCIGSSARLHTPASKTKTGRDMLCASQRRYLIDASAKHRGWKSLADVARATSRLFSEASVRPWTRHAHVSACVCV